LLLINTDNLKTAFRHKTQRAFKEITVKNDKKKNIYKLCSAPICFEVIFWSLSKPLMNAPIIEPNNQWMRRGKIALPKTKKLSDRKSWNYRASQPSNNKIRTALEHREQCNISLWIDVLAFKLRRFCMYLSPNSLIDRSPWDAMQLIWRIQYKRWSSSRQRTRAGNQWY